MALCRARALQTVDNDTNVFGILETHTRPLYILHKGMDIISVQNHCYSTPVPIDASGDVLWSPIRASYIRLVIPIRIHLGIVLWRLITHLRLHL